MLDHVQADGRPAIREGPIATCSGAGTRTRCGDGRLARAVDDLGYRVTAIDPAAPEGAIFQRVALENFADPVGFDAVVAIRVLHHIPDLGAALSMLQPRLVPGGRLIVVENAFDRLDGSTARWYLEQRRASDPGAPSSLQACLAEWQADHAGLARLRGDAPRARPALLGELLRLDAEFLQRARTGARAGGAHVDRGRCDPGHRLRLCRRLRSSP
jgi:SAM-dependent methyltransferase